MNSRAAFFRFLSLALLAIFGTGVLATAQVVATAPPLINTPRTASLSLTPNALEMYPAYHDGLLIEKLGTIRSSDTPNIRLMDANTGKREQIELWYPKASATNLTAIDARVIRGNSYVVSGGYADIAGKPTYFLSVVSSQNSTPVFLPTGAYLPTAIKVASDGSIWTLGSRPHSTNVTPYGALRHYSSDGKLLDHCLARSTTGGEFGPSGNVPRQVMMDITADFVFVYDEQTQTIYQWSIAKRTMKTWKVNSNNLEGRVLTGFVALANAHVFASFRRDSKGSQVLRREHRPHGLFELHRERDLSTTWWPVEGTVSWATKAGDFMQLLGEENGRLVIATKPGLDGLARLSWVSQSTETSVAPIAQSSSSSSP